MPISGVIQGRLQPSNSLRVGDLGTKRLVKFFCNAMLIQQMRLH